MSSAANQLPPGGILIPVKAKSWSDKEFYRLDRVRTTIGRSSNCTVQIKQPSISRIHAELTWTSDGTLIFTHLSPVNPSFVNGVPIRAPRSLCSGDVLEIADGIALRVELFVHEEEAATTPAKRDVRRMYAILYADVVAYSRLVEQNDVTTARRLEERLDIIRHHTESAGGRIGHIQGDSVLAFFTSAVSAVTSAMAWQCRIALLNQPLLPSHRMEFRVGINSGDVLITPSGGTHGDAINIAVRIQAMASSGTIFVSGVVRDQLQGRGDLNFDYMRSEVLKNISHEVRVYRANASSNPEGL